MLHGRHRVTYIRGHCLLVSIVLTSSWVSHTHKWVKESMYMSIPQLQIAVLDVYLGALENQQVTQGEFRTEVLTAK